jgi:plastocyanin
MRFVLRLIPLLIPLGGCYDFAALSLPAGDAAPDDQWQAVPDLTQSPAPDLVHDALPPPSDRAMPDLTMPDFTMPDLAMPDLAMPDLTMPDLTIPDLTMRDLVTVDLTSDLTMVVCGCPVGNGLVCCNGACINILTDKSNCGGCGLVCSSNHITTPTCSNGSCNGTCESGWADCDNNKQTNGCETYTLTNVADCGGCGIACSTVNDNATCNNGSCAISCFQGYADCDSNVATGCETNLMTDPSHCASCTNLCKYMNAVAGCSGGVCYLATCDAGFGNCNNNASDGCEANLSTDANNCGSCGTLCASINGTGACVSGACKESCVSGFGDCDGNSANGCETNLSNNTSHCGSCTNVCPTGNTCSNGLCFNGGCISPNTACNGTCYNLNTDPNHCGSCTNVCAAGLSCCNGACTNTSSDPNHCGSCTSACIGGASCCSGACANLNTDPNHCGTCATVCPANQTCSGGLCIGMTCSPGFTSCNGACYNLGSDPMHCGGCTNVCATGDACCTGACANLGTDVNHCGACGRACTQIGWANVATYNCSGGNCSIASCTTPFADCNGSNLDGCEANLETDPQHCGTCMTDCSLAGWANVATYSCSSGGCGIGSCATGFADCNGITSDGCETDINNDPTNCGGCNAVCASGFSCANGTCTPPPDMAGTAPPDMARSGGKDMVAAPMTWNVAVGPGGSFSFSPSTLTIRVGDTVVWTWMTSGHTVTSGSGCVANNVFCSPNDVGCGNNPSNAGFTYSHTFNTIGTFPYFCVPHCGAGMIGTITVQ